MVGQESWTLDRQVPEGMSLEVADMVGLLEGALRAAVATESVALLVEQMRWQRARLETLDLTHLDAAVTDRAVWLTSDAASPERLRELLNQAIGPHHPAPVDGPLELSPLARQFLEHVVGADRHAAVATIMDAADRGVGMDELLVEVIEATQFEVGRLWERGEISVAQEHTCTAIVQLALAALYPRLLCSMPHRPSVVAVVAGRFAHEVGLRIVLDLLEGAGWRTTFLGSGLEVSDVVDQVVRHDAAIVALSATIAADVGAIRDLIEALRTDPRTAQVRIIVGGRVFRTDPTLAERVGADGYARDAREAVQLCDSLLGG